MLYAVILAAVLGQSACANGQCQRPQVITRPAYVVTQSYTATYAVATCTTNACQPMTWRDRREARKAERQARRGGLR
jgi:hypothetical protein